MNLILASCFILFISILTFLPSFNLALFGDDWLAFFRYAMHVAPKFPGEWINLIYFLTPYGAQDIIMGLLQKIFGFQGSYYQYTSFALRMIAAFSLYPLVFYLTKSKLAAFFAILFFAVTTTGIETTSWVFNMPTYTTIALFNLFLYFFIVAREDKKHIFLTISLPLYFLAYIITPIRMHGSLLFLLFLEVFWIFQKKDRQTIKLACLRFLLLLLIFLIIKFIGQSLGPANEPIERFTLGVTTSLELIKQGRLDFIFYPLIMLGSMLIPDFILPAGFKNAVLLLVGGLVLIITIYLIIKFFNRTNTSTALFLGISWSLLSFFFAWWWVPNTIYPTFHRYLIVSAVGISIILAVIISLGRKIKNQLYLAFIPTFFLILQLISTNYYLKLMEDFHSQKLTDKIWSAMPYIPQVGKEPLVFYFEGDSSNYVILHNVLTFGFPPHMQVLYHLTEADPAPVPMTNWNEVVSAVSDGQSFKLYGYPLKPIPIDHIFAFYLEGKDNLINITDQARQKLLEEQPK